MGLLKRSLGAKILVLVSLLLLVIFTGLFLANSHWQRSSTLKLIEKSSSELSDILLTAISEPMAIGDNEATQNQFRKVSERYKNIKVYLTNFRGEITYSTDTSAVRKNLEQLYQGSEQFTSLFARSLKTSLAEGMEVHIDGTPYFVEVGTIKNESACYHCHGSSRDILGSVVMFNNVSEEYGVLSDIQRYSALISLAGMVLLLVLLVTFMKVNVVNKITEIARVSGEIAKGDYTQSFTIKGEDELASLCNSLGTMVGTIRNQLEYNRGILQGIIVPLFVTDRNGAIEFLNTPMLNILGRPEKQIIGQSVADLFPDRAAGGSIASRALSEGRSSSGVFHFQRSDGVVFPLHYEISPLKDTHGATAGAIGVMIDLTQEEKDKARIREHGENLQLVGDEVTKVAHKMSDAAHQLRRQMDEITGGMRSTTEQTHSLATAMEEMNSTVLEVANNASNVAQTSDRANQVAQEGSVEVRKTVAETREVAQRAGKLAESLNDLSDKAVNIGRIMSVINDIADQTNLLALNAAIEAARAGEAGRGFAVVADEVRKLAEKTIHATKEVENAIGQIQSSTRDAVREMGETRERVELTSAMAEKAGTVLEGIVDQSNQIADMVHGIAAASEEQSATSDEINNNVTQINELSKSVGARIEEANDAIQEVSSMAMQLSELVQRFKNS